MRLEVDRLAELIKGHFERCRQFQKCAPRGLTLPSGEALQSELRRSDPTDRVALGDAVAALTRCSQELEIACPRLGLFPDPLAGLREGVRRG